MSLRKILQRLIIQGLRIDCCDDKGWTALHHASSKGWTEMARSLFHMGAKTDLKTFNGETPLALAVEHAHADIVKLFLSEGNTLKFDVDERCRLMLHNVVRTNKMQSSVNEEANIDWKISLGKIALMLAVQNICEGVLELLIELGVDINCVDDDGCTALHHASSKGCLSMVCTLLYSGADVNIKNLKGETPLMLVEKRSCTDIAKLLFHYGEDSANFDDDEWSKTMLRFASSTGQTEMARWLLKKGADFDSKTSLGETVLMVAVMHSHKDIAELLINSGADIKCCDDKGLTVLHYVALGGSVDIAQYLVNIGADFDLKSRCGATPLMTAVQYSHRSIVELLVNVGANIEICDNNGETLLHYAASTRHVGMVQFLLNKGADFDSANRNGVTPLLKAAKASNLCVVRLLVELDADTDCCDSNRRTLLHFAAYNGWIELVQPLIKKGVDINARMSNGNTALILALERGKLEMANYLVTLGADCNLKGRFGWSGFRSLCSKPDLKTVRQFIKSGACVNSTCYDLLMSKLEFQIFIFKDIKLCSQIIINNFNNKDLPTLYKAHAYANKLPSICKMKIGNCDEKALEVEKAVARDIKVRGYCNVQKVRPLVLSILSVQSFSKYVHAITNQVY